VFARDDTLVVSSYSPVIGNLRQNDKTGSCSPLLAQWTLIDKPQHGTVTVTQDGTYQYMPQADYSGTDTFSYQITFPNNCQSSNVAKVSVNVTCATSQTSDSGSAGNITAILLLLTGYLFAGTYMLRRKQMVSKS
jgi:hypothetical protein